MMFQVFGVVLRGNLSAKYGNVAVRSVETFRQEHGSTFLSIYLYPRYGDPVLKVFCRFLEPSGDQPGTRGSGVYGGTVRIQSFLGLLCFREIMDK